MLRACSGAIGPVLSTILVVPVCYGPSMAVGSSNYIEIGQSSNMASIQRVPTGIRAVSAPQLVGHRLAMELFENPRGGYPADRFTLRQTRTRPCDSLSIRRRRDT